MTVMGLLATALLFIPIAPYLFALYVAVTRRHQALMYQSIISLCVFPALVMFLLISGWASFAAHSPVFTAGLVAAAAYVVCGFYFSARAMRLLRSDSHLAPLNEHR
jgi:hypothetical protein